MDIGTIIGYVIAWGSIIYGAHHASDGQLAAYFKISEVILVGGCALGATIASLPLHSVIQGLKATGKLVFFKETHVDHLIKELVGYAETARRDGVLALETVGREAKDPFLRRGIQLTIDGTDPDVIERIMRIEIEAMIERHKHGKHFWHAMAKFGPGCGLVACLIAQVAMFMNLSGNPAAVGAALSVALTGTLYGAMLQNVIAGPVAERLALRSQEEATVKEIILQGVLAIQAGNNPRVVEMQLLSFMSTGEQAKMAKAA